MLDLFLQFSQLSVSIRFVANSHMERAYGDEKKALINEFKKKYEDDVENLFSSAFQMLEKLNIGEGETTRLVQKLLNAKTSALDALK